MSCVAGCYFHNITLFSHEDSNERVSCTENPIIHVCDGWWAMGDGRWASFKSCPQIMSQNYRGQGRMRLFDSRIRCIRLMLSNPLIRAFRAEHIPLECLQSSWSLSATSFGRSELTREEEEMLTDPVARALSSELRGRRCDTPYLRGFTSRKETFVQRRKRT